jgi:hypothetical protein
LSYFIFIGLGAPEPFGLPLFAGKGFKSDSFGVDGDFSDDLGKGFNFFLVGVPICSCACGSPEPFGLPPLPAKRGRPKGSGAPKPMKIKYDKPGRPALQPDPMEPETTNAPKLRLPRKK